jgi:hypothetical protein
MRPGQGVEIGGKTEIDVVSRFDRLSLGVEAIERHDRPKVSSVRRARHRSPPGALA